ncbi:MAG: rhomboid family intramembrane serine protease [Desulfobacterales bacterium]
MLLVPITGKISWKNPPVVTIALIVINCLIFFVFQRNDHTNFFRAQQHYFKSGLADIEVSAYLADRERSQHKTNPEKKDTLDEQTLIRYYQQMESDTGFQKKLRTGEIITPHDPGYARWKKLRDRYENLLSDVLFFKYGFRPAFANVLTAFTYMFLHGSFGHLLGNMIFLWLVGCMLEMGCGRIFCIAAYILTGLFSVFLFWLIYMDSTIPLVGASGAIAGFMGAFATVFGRTKIKVFYSLGFYFNYIRFPAILLFPLWAGNEFFQLFFGEQSNVAYVAHIGGLLSGALIGYLNLKFFKLHDNNLFNEEPEDKISPLIEKALQCMGKLDLEKGRHLLEAALVIDPENKDALAHLFNIEKVNPENPAFHLSAGRLLQRYSLRREDHKKAYEIYKEYTGLTQRPRLTPETYVRLGSAFSRLGHTRVSEKIFNMLLKKKPDQPGIPAGLLKLATASKKKTGADHWKKFLEVICAKYPNSAEAGIAKNMLQADQG